MRRTPSRGAPPRRGPPRAEGRHAPHARSPTRRRSPAVGPDAPPPRGDRRRGRPSHRRDGLAPAGIAPPTGPAVPTVLDARERAAVAPSTRRIVDPPRLKFRLFGVSRGVAFGWAAAGIARPPAVGGVRRHPGITRRAKRARSCGPGGMASCPPCEGRSTTGGPTGSPWVRHPRRARGWNDEQVDPAVLPLLIATPKAAPAARRPQHGGRSTAPAARRPPGQISRGPRCGPTNLRRTRKSRSSYPIGDRGEPRALEEQ